MRVPPAGSDRSGFTLLEILVALAIFAGAAAALSRLLILGLENAEYADWQSQASMLIETRWAEIQAGVLTLDDAGTYPADEDGYSGWEWTLAVEEAHLDGLFQLTLSVEDVSGGPGNGRALRLVRLYFDETAIESQDEQAMSEGEET